MSGLTEKQLNFFQNEGYLLIEDALNPDIFQLLRAELTEKIDAFARTALTENLLDNLYEQEPFERRLHLLALQLENPTPLVALGKGKKRTPGMFQIYVCPSLLDIVESVLGPEILAHPQFNIRPKRPYRDESVVPWHQDLGYLKPDAKDTFMVNLWIPLVDATRENGCMEVIAGSHRCPLITHERDMGPAGNFKGVIDDNLPDGNHILCQVPLGGILLTQHKTMHRSLPNVSDHIRWSLDLRYSHPDQPTGRNHIPGFIARSRLNPGNVCRSASEWLQIFESANVSNEAHCIVKPLTPNRSV